MSKIQVPNAFRAVLFILLATIASLASAGSSSTSIYPTLSVFDTFAKAPFDPIDPNAAAIEINVTGTWTFVFAHDPSAAPFTGSLYFGSPDLYMYVAGPHANDGPTSFASSASHVVDLTNFTGTETFTFGVDKTSTVPGGGNNLQNFTGPGGPGMLYIEGEVASWMPLVDGDPGSIYLAGGTVENLTVRMTAVPEPTSGTLMLTALASLGLAYRARSVSQRGGR